MAESHIIPDSDDYYDDLVNGDFAEKLAPSDVIKVAQIILEVANGKAAEGTFFVGFVTMEISLEKLKVQLRFSERPEDVAKLTPPDLDELPRKMARFTWHLFARVNSSYRFSHINLPDGFKSYMNLDD